MATIKQKKLTFNKRVQGEWFRLNENDLSFLKDFVENSWQRQ